MKAILLALLAGLMVFVVATAVFRSSRARRTAKTLLLIFLAVTPCLAGMVLLTPADMGFLGSSFVSPSTIVDLGFSLFLYGSGFFGGLLQLYNLADRGFSLRILIDALEHQAEHTSLDLVMSGYSAGKGIVWMYDKRIEGMSSTGLVTLSADEMKLTSKGWRAARVFSKLRELTRQPSMAPGTDV